MKRNIENHVISLLKRIRAQKTNYKRTIIGIYEESDINCCFGEIKVSIRLVSFLNYLFNM